MKTRAREPRLPLWSRPGYLIRRLHKIHCALFLEECKDSGLTPVQYGLLTALSFRGELDQGSLAEELGLDRTSTAEVLSRLEKRGLVTRKPNPRDRRARLARITRRGHTAGSQSPMSSKASSTPSTSSTTGASRRIAADDPRASRVASRRAPC